jgi:hypothetical protein
MKRKSQIPFSVLGLFVVVVFAATVRAQEASPPSLSEQLEAQYTPAKTAANSEQLAVTQPGTVLVIEQPGILAVPPGRSIMPPASYKDGKLNPPGSVAGAMAGKDTRQLVVGEKVYVTRIDVDLNRDRVKFQIIECDACNGSVPPSSYKAEVVFVFPTLALASMAVPDVEDTIAKVFALDTGTPEVQASQPQPQQEQAAPTGPQQAAQPAPAQDGTAEGLRNDEIVRMAQAKLADSVIIAKIKASACNFDTSTDALIKLKQLGVSDAVLQAMAEAVASPPPAAAPETASANDQSGPAEPYALVDEGQMQRPLPSTRADIALVKSEWQGDSLQSAAADPAIGSAVLSAGDQAAGTSAVAAAGTGLAAVPVVGVYISSASSLIGLRKHKVTETVIWAIPFSTSKSALAPGSKIEIFFDGIPGVDLSEYRPLLVKLEPTKSNMRLVSARNVEIRGTTAKGKEQVVSEAQPAKASTVSPGHVVVESEQPLPPGEYGVLLQRKNDQSTDAAGNSSMAANQKDLARTVWDFTVQAPRN